MPTFIPGVDDSGYAGAQTIPSDYAASLEQLAPTITDKIVEQQTPGESWTDSLARLLPILAATEQQRQLLQVQADRAAKGLPPLNASQYGTGVQIGLDAQTKNILILAAIGIVAVIAMKKGR